MKSKVRYKRRGSHKGTPSPIDPQLLPGLRGRAEWHVVDSGEADVAGIVNYWGVRGEATIPFGDSDREEFTRAHELMHMIHSPLGPPADIEVDGDPVEAKYVYLAEEVRINRYAQEEFLKLMSSRETIPSIALASPHSRFGTVRRDIAKGVADVIRQRIKDAKPFDKTIYDDLMRAVIIASGLYQPPAGSISDAGDYINWGGAEPDAYNISETIYKELTKHSRDRRLKGYESKDGSKETIRRQRLWWDTAVQAVIQLFKDVYSTCRLRETREPTWTQTRVLAHRLQMFMNHVDIIPDAIDKVMEDTAAVRAAEDFSEIFGDMVDELDTSTMTESMAPGTGEGEVDKETFDGVKSMIKDHTKDYAGREIGPPIWAPMKITSPKLNKKLPIRKLAKNQKRSSDMGIVPNQIHRTLIDGQVFSRKVTSSGGSVLIDDSGSMNWNHDQIAKIVHNAPAVTVAAYSSDRSESPEGELMIIAKDGKWQDRSRPQGMENDCDLPALEWLAQQDKPRIWVTDGGVIPLRGDWGKAAKDCVDFALANDINVVKYVEDAEEVFQGLREIER